MTSAAGVRRTSSGGPSARLGAGHPAVIAAAVVSLAAAIGLQIVRDRQYPLDRRETERMLYVRSGEALKRIWLEFDAVGADTYWIRAIQHYGGDRLAGVRMRKYELLFPLLDIATTLDPYFNIAYRFGAIFLSEGYPGGPGRPDQAVALLRKGIAAQPGKWQYYHDIAFVHYWQLRDFNAAAEWFQRAAAQPNAPNWLQPLAASMLARGGDRTSARFLWRQLLGSEQVWMRRNAEKALLQLDALDAIEVLEGLVGRHAAQGRPFSWNDLVSRGVLRDVPRDPTGVPFELDPVTGDVTVSSQSSLHPMPVDFVPTR
jgi:tetratricopeptide (TPR) repeat protein